MNKADKLDKLDNLLLDTLLDIMDSKEFDRLPDLATVSNYLSKNNRVEEKKKSTLEKDIAKRTIEAEKRRKKCMT